MDLSKDEQAKHFRDTVHRIFKGLALAKEANEPATAAILLELDGLLTWLSKQFESTEWLQKQLKVRECLLRIHDRFEQQIPEAYRDRVKTLREVCVQEQGTSIEPDEDTDAAQSETPEAQTDPDTSPQTPTRASRPFTTSAAPATTSSDAERYAVIADHGRVRLPPLDHPIFGRGGIMFGLALKRNPSRMTPILDTSTPGAVRPFGRYGHNGHAVNAWFPTQMASLAQGVHGWGVRGLSGDREQGAYSFVVAGAYDNDRVTENRILYSPTAGPGRDQDIAILRASLKTGNAARVLIAASYGGSLAPTVGLQYVGLYKCVGTEPRNASDDESLLFEFRRINGQVTIDTTVPSLGQRRQFERSKAGY